MECEEEIEVANDNSKVANNLKFQDIVMECTNDVCGMRRIGDQRIKVVSGGMKKRVGRWPKREERLRNGYREEIGLPLTYRVQRVAMKRAVKVAKIMEDWRWGERLGNYFEGNKKKGVLERGKASEER